MDKQTGFEIQLNSTEDTRQLGFELASRAEPRLLIALSGPLGAGKTTFAQGAGQALAVAEAIVSPTFVMINEYTSGRLPFYHLDLYRLEDAGITGGAAPQPDLYMLESELDELGSAPGLILIEWAERLISYIAQQEHVWVELNYSKSPHDDHSVDESTGEAGRTARISAHGIPALQIVEALRNVYFS